MTRGKSAAPASEPRSAITRLLNTVEFLGNLLPHPVTLFALLALLIVLLSGVAVRLTRDYDRKIRAGEASPRLDAADFPELGDTIDRSIWTATKTVAPMAAPADTPRG